jgi:superfamily II DNA or RNA helicase/HKD family nuclease
MPTITNEGTNTLSANLKSILPNCDRIDALVGYFYFSGFKDLHNELKDKKIRILVGMDIDNKILEKVSTLKELNLDNHVVETKISSRSAVKDDYIENFSKIFNDTDYFDNEESQKAFEIFLDKIRDGSLEIKKTAEANHSKFYILHEKTDEQGIVIVGSSNLTISGLKEQREHNIVLSEKHYYESHIKDFEHYWNDSENIIITDIELADDFIDNVKKKIWLFALPEPVLMYYKVLNEYFAVDNIGESKYPGVITGGKYSDLKYQKDAIDLGIDKIKKFGGVIVADVVGLGKSIIASAIAHNLAIKTIIIAPPHLENQWKDYMAEFDFKGFVYTTGKVEEALERHSDNKGKMLIILDEAHKHRNEDTDNYKKLHKLCAGNLVMALSATPFNNEPKDIYALIKLFSTPGQSTIKTVENLSMSFNILFKRYKAIKKDIRKNSKENDGEENFEIREELHSIADELRKMIEPLVIRRSRLDLEEIEDYRDDLKKQGVSFAKVKNPELLEYDLGEMFDLYVDTLNRIASEDKNACFIGARYKPAKYLKKDSDFLNKLSSADEDDDEISVEEKIHRIQQGQDNVSKFMRRLLVRRFESSIGAFNLSLKNMIDSSEKMLDWYIERGEVPILKKGYLLSVDELADMTDKEQELLFDKLEGKGLIRIPKSELEDDFETDLRHDIVLLKNIQKEWQQNKEDPKFDFFEKKINQSIRTDKKRKIIVFTEFSDTANYLYSKLKKNGFERVFKYSSEDASNENKDIIKRNFDAGVEDSKQLDDFDLIVATDAISEGFNLHRAGIVINYDIPYNPTRVIQRVGRINRINKKVFEELYIYNFFPTATGEIETRTREISTLKMDLIHSLLGEDTKIFTKDEDLKNYFAQKYREENSKSERLSWDAKYRNVWLKIKDDVEILEKIEKIPHRSRIARKSAKSGVVAFAKKGGSYVFAYGKNAEDVQVVSPQTALPLFEADESEKAVNVSVNFEPIYAIAKNHIFKDNTKASVDGGRKQDSLNKIKLLSEIYPKSKDLCIDIIKAIKDLDALPNGILRDIAVMKIDKNDPEKTFQVLKEMVPTKYLMDIFSTADRANDSGKLIVLSEELTI